METESNRIYFTGLDSLRALGAFTVLFGHIELSKKYSGLPNLMELPFFKYTSGHLGVILFFVLSGFLITYLLLKEKQTYDTIRIRNFYMRRILRIWPIYYLIVLLLFFVLPQIIHFEYYAKPDWKNLQVTLPSFLIYLLMIPNLVSFGILGLGGGFQLGSIGTEEQFYIIWPWLIRWSKNILIPLILIMIIVPLLPHACDYFAFNFYSSESKIFIFLKQLGNFFTYFKINCMAIGGLFAWLYYTKNKTFLVIVYSKWIQIIALLIGLGGWFIGFHLPMFTDELYSFFFAIIIINTATNPNKIVSFDYRLTNYLGKISYGIYVYHWALIYLIFDCILPYQNNKILFNFILYLSTVGLTILIAHLSYYHFELWFLKFKDRFSKIKTYQQYGT